MKSLLTAIAACLVLSPAAAFAAELDAAFDILRKGERIGFHAVSVEEMAGGGARVETRIDMKVKVGPIPVFRYEHVSTEIWKDGLLQSVESRTDNNGKDETLRVRRDGDALVVDGTKYRGPGPGDVIPSSYWNKVILGATTLLDTQNGRLIDVKVESLGQTPSPSGDSAEQHRISGSVDLNLWYDGPRWVGADFFVRGQALTYRPVNDDARAQLFARLNFDAGR